MMRQLGITRLRPGPSGNEQAPDHANFDESEAGPIGPIPDALVLRDGTRVTSPEMWWKQRRPELVEDFSREIYGRVPANVPGVTWTVLYSEREFFAGHMVMARELRGRVDNAADPAITVELRMTEVVPIGAPAPVPMLVMFGRTGVPAAVTPPPGDIEKINAALRQLLSAQDPSLAQTFREYPAYSLVAPGRPFGFSNTPPSPQEFLVQNGWGFALLDPTSIQADDGAGLRRGIIGLVNRGNARKPDEWGALRAWAWGAGKAFDYLSTDPAVDSKRIGIEGVSRYGKAALVALAFDQRFAVGLIGSSGQGGAKLHRRNFGESVENLAGGEYYWMAGNFIKYAAAESTFGEKTASDLPVDANELIALCAPRLVFISYGSPEHGDAKWLDQRGSYMAAVAAQPVFRLLGAKDLGVPDDYLHARLPPIESGLLDGHLAWRQHDGGHTDAPNFPSFLAWADRQFATQIDKTTPTIAH